MTTEIELMPDESREPAAGGPVLSGRRAFLLKWGKGSKAVMAGFILGSGLLGIGQEATAEKDRNNSDGGWVTPSQGWVTPSQGWVTPSQGWVTPSQGWVTPNQGGNNPNQGWGNPNQGWNNPNQRWDHPNQGWDHRGRGNGVNR